MAASMHILAEMLLLLHNALHHKLMQRFTLPCFAAHNRGLCQHIPLFIYQMASSNCVAALEFCTFNLYLLSRARLVHGLSCKHLHICCLSLPLQDEAMEDAPASQPPAKTIAAPAPTAEAPIDTAMPDATEETEAAGAAEPAAAPSAHVTADDTQEVRIG
jgi:hypothetical protein